MSFPPKCVNYHNIYTGSSIGNKFTAALLRFFPTMAGRSDKFFSNPYQDYSQKLATTVLHNGNLRQDSALVQSLSDKWNTFLERTTDSYNRDYTVYTGNAGIALVKLLKDPHDPDVLQEIKQQVLSAKYKRRDCTFLCGDAGSLAIGAVVAHRLKDLDTSKALVKDILDLKAAAINGKSILPNEYLYGRAGYLFSLLWVNKNINPSPISNEIIRQVIEAIFTSGTYLADNGKAPCPLMYEWYETYYLGAAHGFTGILYLLLQVPEYINKDELNKLIRPTIEYLATLKLPSGNFPADLGDRDDSLVQWCHGAPGFLYLFSQAAKIFKHQPYMDIALKCGDVIWERGLLAKGYSLCHGVAGNAYCFLELYQQTKDVKHLYRAIKFAEWCLDYSPSHELHRPDRPCSLFEGIAGPMYLLLDIQNPMEAKFPGYTL